MIEYFSEGVVFELRNPLKISDWLISVAENEGNNIERINIIFCTDAHLLNLNQTFLGHDYYTDILTFPFNNPRGLEGDIYISIDRVKENSRNNSYEKELHRVMVHGLLHLLGYEDNSDDEKLAMRAKEDFYLKSVHLNRK